MSTNVPSGAPRPFSEVKTIKVALHHSINFINMFAGMAVWV
jgi:hypothetical protein